MPSLSKKLFPLFVVIALLQPLITLAQQPATTTATQEAVTCTITDPEKDSTWRTALDAMGIKDGLIIPCACIDSVPNQVGVNPGTPCTLNEVFALIVNIMRLILSITGSAALLMFIYGGFMFIISSGNDERVKKAKDILSMAATGLAIIFVAFLIVNTLINVLTSGNTTGPAEIKDIGTFGQQPRVK